LTQSITGVYGLPDLGFFSYYIIVFLFIIRIVEFGLIRHVRPFCSQSISSYVIKHPDDEFADY